MMTPRKPSTGMEKIRVYDISSNDPHGQLVNTSGLSDSEISQISELMLALGSLREAERKVNDAAARYMHLNETDMRALHFLIVAENTRRTVTAGDIGHHLGISAASTTKLLDRLETGGHVTRSPHPSDRRALQIHITPHTREAAFATVGKHQARRFLSASRLNEEERNIIIHFLHDMTQEIDLSNADWTTQ